MLFNANSAIIQLLKMKGKKHKKHTVRTVTKYNWKIAETESKLIPPKTHLYDLVLPWLVYTTGISIKSGRVKLVYGSIPPFLMK